MLTPCQSASRNGKIIHHLTGWKYILVMKHFRVSPHTPFPSIVLGHSRAIMKTIAQKSILVFITPLSLSCSLPVVPAHRPSEARSHYFICSMLGPVFSHGVVTERESPHGVCGWSEDWADLSHMLPCGSALKRCQQASEEWSACVLCKGGYYVLKITMTKVPLDFFPIEHARGLLSLL